MRPLEGKPDPLASGRAPALHALLEEYLTIPVFEPYPFSSPITRRMRPLSVGRVENAFHPAKCHSRVIQISCKGFSQKIFAEMARRRWGRASGALAAAP